MGAPQREWRTQIQALKKLTANHPPVILKSNTATSLKNFGMFEHHLLFLEQFTESQAAS